MKALIFSALLCISFSSVQGTAFNGGQQQPQPAAVAPAAGTPITFLTNGGQVTDQYNNTRPDVQFTVHGGPGLNVFIGNGAIHYQFYQVPACKDRGLKDMLQKIPIQPDQADDAALYRMDVVLAGANKNATIITEGEMPYEEHYFNGATGDNTLTAHAYSKIIYKEIYPNIDWVLNIAGGHLKHEFVIRPGGDPTLIKLRYEGASGIALNADGSLTASTPLGTISEHAPVSFEANGAVVKSNFVLKGNELSYETGHYTGSLTIDPSLAWATYFGGDGEDLATGVALDPSGNIIMSGRTSSVSHIATTGAYLSTYGGSDDVFISKFNSAGAILWSTYYGGGSEEWAQGMDVDASGNIYVVGHSWSNSGIATTGAYQAVYGGASAHWGDAFIAKFSPSGTLLWGSYFGGAADDIASAVKVTATGDVIMSGGTLNNGLATPGAYITVHDSTTNSFLAKFTNSGALIWSTYCEAGIACLTTDAAGNIYVAGYADSSLNVATPGAHQTVYGGDYCDAYVAKFNSSGFRQWGTFYGGSGSDFANQIATDDAGKIYVTGSAYSPDGIATPGAFKTTVGAGDMFLAKFNNNGSRVWGTYYGGDNAEDGRGIAIDHAYNIFLTGLTESDTGISTPDGWRIAKSDTGFTSYSFSDAYLVKFDSSGARLWGTYYGGERHDAASAVAVNNASIVIAGSTSSQLNMATAGAYQTTLTDFYSDVMLVRFNNCTIPVAATLTGPDSVCIGSTILISAGATTGTWTTTSTAVAIVSGGVVSGLHEGWDTVQYTISNPCGSATARKAIYVLACPDAIPDNRLLNTDIVIFPNPAGDVVHIISTSPIGRFSITDIVGKVVYTTYSSSNDADVSMAAMPPGIYFVRVGSNLRKITKK